MEFQLPIQIEPLPRPIGYPDKIMLTGSCFTEHIGNALRDWKFDMLQNPNGILFDPASVASSIITYMEGRPYEEKDLVYFNELWQSWQHHSQFSHIDKGEALACINESLSRAHTFLKEAKWLIITLGSAFSYRLAPDAPVQFQPGRRGAEEAGGMAVANCHRAPGQIFHKHLMTIEEINTALDGCLYRLFQFNPSLQVIFTVSPVRHIRDGVIENNRSKARLIESVHHLVNKFDRLYYFPAYELVIDVLRDYRFYDIDMVHPNYPATQYVLEQFTRHYIDKGAQAIMEEVKRIVTARRHKPFQPSTQAHKRFLQDHLERTKELALRCPFLDLREELEYFGGTCG
ncbi:MAG: GSCFA domain-containing protein [Chitinophagaceae bacterium]|nr:GSCFA domain-containing protein [Chitinophagaceae bacterium]